MRTIGIIGAMEIEVQALKNDLKDVKTFQKAGMNFIEGILNGQKAVVVKSGVGKVNAAVCAQILIDRFEVDAIINTGIAGSLKAEINIGDIVVSTDLVHHDMDATGFGYELGQVPQMDIFAFPADKELSELAAKACEEVNPEIEVFHGRIVSGDQFVSDRTVKEKIVATYDAFCTEMEGAAIAQAAFLNQIPCVVLRAISDKADESATMDYPVFEKQAVSHCVNLVERLFELMNKN